MSIIQRFDRELVSEVDQPPRATSRRYAVHRKMFASAETVLRPRGSDPLGHPERSYVGFFPRHVALGWIAYQRV